MTLWGGRFQNKADAAAFAFNASLAFDQRMAAQDVRGSIAWAGALVETGILTPEEGARIHAGLSQIADEFAAGEFAFAPGDEDIHTAVERRLGEIIGPLAGKLHTGRSRNDQVATDFRLWVLDHVPQLDTAIQELQAALVCRAEADIGIPMPGYTHLQRAQPVLMGHWWLSHFWPLERDRQRLAGAAERAGSLPLGCGALAGAPFPVDRWTLAKMLGFHTPAQNSIDAVSDRDFAAEFLFFASMAGIHLSKLAEAVIIFTSSEFGFITLDDAYSTGSSLMPQKKNPDHFELARGKAGTLIGSLMGLLTTLKGLPSTYDKDLQEDKPPVFAAADTLLALLPVLAGALRTLTVHSEKMRAAIDASMLATDLADYLVDKGVPFREAHSLVGAAVRLAGEKNVGLDELPPAEYAALHPAFAADVPQVFDIMSSLARRSAIGGTAPEAVREQLAEAKRTLASAA